MGLRAIEKNREHAAACGIDREREGPSMSGLHDVVISTPMSAHKVAEAMHAELDEQTGRLTLLRDVHVTQPLVLHEEYSVTSKDPRRSMRARFAGPDHASPGALVFGVVPRTSGRS
jgi:hypothetical protein